MLVHCFFCILTQSQQSSQQDLTLLCQICSFAIWKRRDTGHASTPKVSKGAATGHVPSSHTAANTFPHTSFNSLLQMCSSYPQSVQVIHLEARINPFLPIPHLYFKQQSCQNAASQLPSPSLLSPHSLFRVFLVVLIKNLPLKYH